jgi:hypothetical protein
MTTRPIAFAHGRNETGNRSAHVHHRALQSAVLQFAVLQFAVLQSVVRFLSPEEAAHSFVMHNVGRYRLPYSTELNEIAY